MTEEVLYQAHPAMFRNHPLGFVLSVLLIAVGVGLVILLVWYVKSVTETLTVTNEDLSYEQGILSRARSEVRLTSIRSVRVNQSLLQRIFGTGDIAIFTAGDTPEVLAKGIPDPGRVRELIDEHS